MRLLAASIFSAMLMTAGAGFAQGAKAPVAPAAAATAAANPATEKAYREARSAYGSADYSKVIKMCDEVIKADPRHADALALRGKAKKDMGDIDAATADLNKAIEINPAMFEAFYIRGQVQEIMGEMKKAQADYAKACAGGFKEACK